MTYPNGTVLHYDYGTSGSLNDVISRLNSLIQGSTTVEGYAYLGLSTVVLRSHPEDGIDLTYVKQTGEADGDAGDQYIGLDRFGRVHDQRWIDAGGVDQDRFFYTYDADGNVTEKGVELDSHLSETYTYDHLNRLTSTTRDPNGTPTTYQSFGLDAVGNINSVTDANGTVDRTTNDQNELTSIGSQTLAFDNNGNTTTDDQGHTLIYDAWNRLIEVKDGSTVLESYVYDGMGRRITEAPGSGSPTDLYYSSQDQAIEERQGGYATAQYVWSAVYVNAMVLRDSDADHSGDSTMEQRIYVTQDANFNVTSVVTKSAPTTWAIAERFVYDAYGNFTVHAINWTSTTDSLAWNYTFQGMRWDSIVNMNFSMTREYSPTMMRWISQDPMGYVNGANRYGFVADNPINSTDVTGLFASHVHIAMTQAVLDQIGGMDGWAKFHIIAANWGTDVIHFLTPKYHAQTNSFVPWVDLTRKEMNVIIKTEYHSFPDKDKVAHEMGRVLHGLQDFYSHTDYIEGNSSKMLTVYKQYPNNKSAKSLLANAKQGHGVGTTLNMDKLYSGGAIMGDLSGVIAYEGGTNPFADDAHNLFSADDAKEGRDLHERWRFLQKGVMVGYSGAFNDAKNTAQTQTMEFVIWARHNMTCSMLKAIFNTEQR